MLTKQKTILIGGAALIALAHILLEYFTGGVVTHYPLADANNPGISNWWGLITFPTLTWAALSLIEKRESKHDTENAIDGELPLQKRYFLGGLVFGILMAGLWEIGQEDILQYLILLPFVFALGLRIYLPETTLGFVLGMAYTFGGVLPVIFAVIIQTIGFLIYTIFYRGGTWLLRR